MSEELERVEKSTSLKQEFCRGLSVSRTIKVANGDYIKIHITERSDTESIEELYAKLKKSLDEITEDLQNTEGRPPTRLPTSDPLTVGFLEGLPWGDQKDWGGYGIYLGGATKPNPDIMAVVDSLKQLENQRVRHGSWVYSINKAETYLNKSPAQSEQRRF